MVMKKSNGLGSVSIERSGAGLPYAPINWPNPGDIWTWKVGKRVASGGFYRDRYIFPPPRLKKEAKGKPYFHSKKSITTYLQSEFPEVDIAAFFSSFSWKVPVSMSCSREKAQVTPCPKKVHPRPKSERNGVTECPSRRSQRIMSAICQAKDSSEKFPLSGSKEVKNIFDLCSSGEKTGSCESTDDNSKSVTDSDHTRVTSSKDTGSPAQSFRDGASCHSPKELRFESIPDDSNMRINSENNSLSQSLPGLSDLALVTYQSPATLEEMAEARKKLSLLLATDNPVLLSSIKLSEILHLSSLLKTDPNLNADQHDILKLIDEIPLACMELQENEKTTEAADKFKEDLETNIARAATLEIEYNESKGYQYLLNIKLESCSREIKKLEEQIATLQSQRDELTNVAEMKKNEADMLVRKQEMVAECLPSVVKEIEMGKKQRAEWELKKQMSDEQKVKILSKFAHLKGFSL